MDKKQLADITEKLEEVDVAGGVGIFYPLAENGKNTQNKAAIPNSVKDGQELFMAKPNKFVFCAETDTRSDKSGNEEKEKTYG